MLLDEVKAKAKDAAAATVGKLLCVGAIDAAEKVVLEALSGDEGQGRLLGSLQLRPLSDDPSAWYKDWQILRDRPAVSAAFNKVARDLPDSMYPAN